jgi:hypothetical protein
LTTTFALGAALPSIATLNGTVGREEDDWGEELEQLELLWVADKEAKVPSHQ